MAYGWKPKNPDHPLLFLKDYCVARGLGFFDHHGGGGTPDIPPTTTVDWTPRIPPSDLAMLGNDQWGDCVEAAMYHADQSLSGDTEIPTEAEALGIYSSITGFNPNQPNTDQGTDIPTALDWWIANPLPGSGTRLGGYFSLDVNDLEEVALADQLGGVILIGFNVPASAETQFDAGQEWVPVAHSQIEGGHCITIDEVDPSKGTGITWAKYQTFSWTFWQQYVQEAYVLFAEEWVSPSGTAPNGVLWSAMNADIQTMFGKPGPFTDPSVTPVVPPVIPPAPATYTPVQAIAAISQIVEATSTS